MKPTANMINVCLGSGIEVVTLSSPECPVAAKEFVSKTTPDATIYHQREYMDLSRGVNGFADIFVIIKGGRPMVAIPLHKWGRIGFTTGYSGILLPPKSEEKSLKKSVDLLVQFLKANEKKGFRINQSAQSLGGIDSKRQQLISSLLASQFTLNGNVFTRLIDVSLYNGLSRDCNGYDWLVDGALINSYQAELRNQIRKAVKSNLKVLSITPNSNDEAQNIYSKLYPLYVQSKVRTGMAQQTLKELIEVSDAIRRGGGRDLIVLIKKDDEILSVVNSHVFNSTAIYWMNCSTDEGLQLNANPLALHASIIESAVLGAKSFEVGRIDSETARKNTKELAIWRYKGQFGGDVMQLCALDILPPVYRALLSTKHIIKKFISK